MLVNAIFLDTFEEFKLDLLKDSSNRIRDLDVFEATIYTIRQAYIAGFVDSIGRYEDAKQIAAQITNITERYTVCDFIKKKKSLFSILNSFFREIRRSITKGFYLTINEYKQINIPHMRCS